MVPVQPDNLARIWPATALRVSTAWACCRSSGCQSICDYGCGAELMALPSRSVVTKCTSLTLIFICYVLSHFALRNVV